jgi:hypothetical protein
MLCAVAAVGSACAVHSGPPSRGGDPAWTEVVTEHFVLSTNLSAPRALDMAQTLEETRHALVNLAWTGARGPRGRTDVVVFARPSEFSHFSGMATSAGVAVTREGSERFLSFSPGADNGLPSIAVHELAHDVSQWFMPVMPPWLAEGMATYMESLTFDRETGQASLGGLSKSSIEWLKTTSVMVRSANLFRLDTFRHEDARSAASFYSSAWLLIHFLLNEHGEAFGRFQSRLAKLEGWREAWDAEFHGLSHDALDEALVAYAARTGFNVLQGRIPAPPFTPVTRALSRAEVHGVLARMSLVMGLRELAERERSEAARLDPSELNALIVRYELLGPAAVQARIDIARQAVAAHPTRAAAWLLLVKSAAGEAERSTALARANELSPDHPSVRTLLAKQRLASNDPKAAFDHSRVAVRRSPYSLELLSLHVRILAANSRCDEAERVERNVEGLLGESCTLAQEGSRRIPCVDYLRESWASTGCAR